jgi:hypothetical protein
MRFLHYILLITALFLASACVPQTTLRHSSTYSKTLQASGDMLVLPAEITVNTVDIGNQKERMYNYEYHLEELFNQQLIAALAKKGYRAHSIKKQDIHERQLDDALIRLRQRYNTATTELYTPRFMEKTAALSITKNLGEAPAEIGQRTGSNLLILADYSSAVKTSGARTKDLAISLLIGGSNTADTSAMSLSIIDATSGTILWSHIMDDTKTIYSSALDNMRDADSVDNARFAQLINNLLAPLPDKSQLGITE